jgi:hypothetical protein
MSDGRKNKPDEMKLITVDPEEFNDIVKRVHGLLVNRVEKAKDRKDAKPTKRADKNHVEAAKDAFVFVHMMELIEHMSSEISDLREIIAGLGEAQQEGLDLPDMFSPKKTHFLN